MVIICEEQKNKYRGQIVIDRDARQRPWELCGGKGTELKMKNPSRGENTGRYMAKVCLKNVTDKIPASPAIVTGFSNNSGAAFPKAREKL